MVRKLKKEKITKDMAKQRQDKVIGILEKKIGFYEEKLEREAQKLMSLHKINRDELNYIHKYMEKNEGKKDLDILFNEALHLVKLEQEEKLNKKIDEMFEEEERIFLKTSRKRVSQQVATTQVSINSPKKEKSKNILTREELGMLKETNKKKLGDNKTEKFTMRISEKEKKIIEELKSTGIDFVDEVRKLILSLDKNISKSYLQDEWISFQNELEGLNLEITNLQNKVSKIKKIENKSQEQINEMEKCKYMLIDLRRERKRIEKYLEKYKIIFE